MKLLRISTFPWGGHSVLPGVTMATRDVDMTVPLEEVVKTMPPTPGVFRIMEIITVPKDLGPVAASIHVATRATELAEDERNMALLYYWDAMAMAQTVAGGVVTGTEPAPLTVAQVEEVLEQLKLHPNYKGHRITVFAKDYTPVTLMLGHVGKGKLV